MTTLSAAPTAGVRKARHRPLDRHRTLGRVHYAAELCEYPITGGVKDATAELFNHGKYIGLMRLEILDGGSLVSAHERAVTGDVGGEDGSQFARNL